MNLDVPGRWVSRPVWKTGWRRMLRYAVSRDSRAWRGRTLALLYQGQRMPSPCRCRALIAPAVALSATALSTNTGNANDATP